MHKAENYGGRQEEVKKYPRYWYAKISLKLDNDLGAFFDEGHRSFHGGNLQHTHKIKPNTKYYYY
jgi:hypothetical protein